MRAAYLILPEADEALQYLGASWCLDALGERFLLDSLEAPAQLWLEETRTVLQERRRGLAWALRNEGMAVLESPANFLLAQVGDPLRARRALARIGVAARDASSFGLPGWFRFAAPREDALVGQIAEVLGELGESAAGSSERRVLAS